MEQKTLAASVREQTKKGGNRRLRRTGKIPATIYGHTTLQTIAVDEHEFNQKFHTVSESTIIKLRIGDKDHDVLIRDFQENILTGKIQHIDFYEIEQGKQLKTNVAVHLLGNSIGVREGGILEQFVHDVEVECLPKDLPHVLEIDISTLELGHSIHIREMERPEGVRVINAEEQVVCAVAYKRAEEVEEEEEVEGEEELLAGEEEMAEDTQEKEEG